MIITTGYGCLVRKTRENQYAYQLGAIYLPFGIDAGKENQQFREGESAEESNRKCRDWLTLFEDVLNTGDTVWAKMCERQI